jgi:hypothetical protein
MAGGGSHLVIPPVNFELVAPGVYRSGFPTRRNIEFLHRLGLRSVLRLSVREKKYSPEVSAFFADNGVRIIECMTEGNRVRCTRAVRCSSESRQPLFDAHALARDSLRRRSPLDTSTRA